MPAMMTCPTCGFNGPHGFTDPGVGGITMFYHSTPTDTCRSYTVEDQWFTTKEEAWRFVRPRLRGADTNWLKAWDAEILEHNHAKYEKFMAKWRAEHE